jgi:hypothetical protein
MTTQLPVPVRRVSLRPGPYEPELIPSLSKCFEIIEQTKVRLRGWDYPHLSSRANQQGQGLNWVASWSDFRGHNEYWRLYQSGQFLHLFSVREATEQAWRIKLEETTKVHLSHLNINWPKVPGFISILNFLYTVTEIFEFTTRLCQRGLYRGPTSISIELKYIRGFVLTVDPERAWSSYHAASEEVLGKTWTFQSDALIAESSRCSLDAVVWFFERFGWLNPPVDVLRKDQEQFLKGLV